MKQIVLLIVFFLCYSYVSAQEEVKLWVDRSPSIINKFDEAERIDGDLILNVTVPTISIYHPDKGKSKKRIVIICPGGGYGVLAMQHEGHQFADWLRSEGYTAVVLKYRLPNKKYKEVSLDDLREAIRYVRSKSKVWNVEKIGVSGFSAGGHLAAMASTLFESAETRPDFSILYYPVITMDEKYTHLGSRINLLGESPSGSDIYRYSTDKQVNADTPPTILFLNDDDEGVVPQNGMLYYGALKNNNIPASLYVFPKGGHGWGMFPHFPYHEEMKRLLLMWLTDL